MDASFEFHIDSLELIDVENACISASYIDVTYSIVSTDPFYELLDPSNSVL